MEILRQEFPDVCLRHVIKSTVELMFLEVLAFL